MDERASGRVSGQAGKQACQNFSKCFNEQSIFKLSIQIDRFSICLFHSSSEGSEKSTNISGIVYSFRRHELVLHVDECMYVCVYIRALTVNVILLYYTDKRYRLVIFHSFDLKCMGIRKLVGYVLVYQVIRDVRFTFRVWLYVLWCAVVSQYAPVITVLFYSICTSTSTSTCSLVQPSYPPTGII